MNTDPNASTAENKKGFSRFLPAIARILLGLPLVVFGANFIVPFLPMKEDPTMSAEALAFAGALMKSGYMMKLIGVTQLVSGAFLLTNRFVPLGLAILAPFLVNSLAFHVFLAPQGLPMVGVFLAFELYLAWCYRRAFLPMLTAKVQQN